MNLPHDPVMLLSVVNSYLKDKYSSLDSLCTDLNSDKSVIVRKLSDINYEYDETLNQFK